MRAFRAVMAILLLLCLLPLISMAVAETIAQVYGCRLDLASLRFAAGDELLTTDHEYNAVLNEIRTAAARDGARVVVARIPFPIRDPGEVIDLPGL